MKVRTNLLAMLAAVLLCGGGTAFFVVAFSAQDAVWFARGFQEVPIRVIVYHDGQKSEYNVGTQGYNELAEGVRASLDRGVARISGSGLSADSLQDACSKYVTVEAYFDQPVKLHAWFYTGNPTRMLFPITGRHSEDAVVFLATTGNYMSVAPVLKTKQPLLDALGKLGYPLQ